MKEQLHYRAKKRLLQQSPVFRSPDQFDLLQETDWDAVVVLDACRTDVLADVAPWPIDSAISPASCTPEWLEAVAADRTFAGTHVVSANPQYEKTDRSLGCETIEPFWENHWRSDLQTTLPEPVLDRVGELLEDRSRVVGHLQQPHWPYVARLGDRWTLAYDDLGPWHVETEEVSSVQVAMQRGLIDIDRARRAYRASVESTWNVLVEYLARWIDRGNTVVVTADHGETFGQRRELGFFEHPCGCHLERLVRVPWVEVQPETPTREDGDLEDRLRALGYAE